MKAAVSTKNTRWIILLLTAIFLVPLILAWYLQAKNLLFTHKTTNHGVLIQPPYDFSLLDAKDSKGNSIPANAWKGHWILMYANSENCDDSCKQKLFFLHQIRTATGKDSQRIQNAVLDFNDIPTDKALQVFLTKNAPLTLHFSTNYKTYESFINRFSTAKKTQKDTVFLIDPHGNVFMVYPHDVPPMDIYNDLTHLLKLSHIG
jgi:cytochrome oxidase Cu insertion factor (SCO1/SenC/PrrC family)